MIRTQIQLSKEQFTQLRALAHRHRVSVAELVRRGVDKLLESGPAPEHTLRQRALQLAGAFHDTATDVSTRHDEHLAAVYRR